MINMNAPGTRVEVTIDEGGLRFTGRATGYQVETSYSGDAWSFQFGHLEVNNVRSPQVRFIEPERRGIKLEPGAKLEPGDLVDVYMVHPDGEPIFPFADTQNLTVESSEEGLDSRYIYFVDCPYRVKVELWENWADDGYEVRMVEPAGEKVGDWSTLEDGDVVNIIQRFPATSYHYGDKFRREVSLYDVKGGSANFDTEADGSSAAIKDEGDVIYLVSKREPELGPDVPWILIDRLIVGTFVGTPAYWSQDPQAYVGVGGEWVGVYFPIGIFDSWTELEEPSFTAKEKA